MKAHPRMFVALSGVVFLCVVPLLASAQPADDVESLRRQVEEQKAQIEQLRSSVERQQRLLEILVRRLEPGGGSDVRLASMPPAAPAAAVSMTQSTANAAAPQPKPDAQPNAVESGFGKIKFNGLFQGWLASGNSGFRDTFRIRRVELKFSGQIAPMVKWTAMIEPSRGLSLNNSVATVGGVPVVTGSSVNQGSRILQDAFITLSPSKRLNVDFGQVKLPLSLEGTQSSSRLDTVERALFISDGGRGGNLGDVRDIGVMVSGPLHPSFDYWLGAFNGVNEHQNDVDRNDQKAVIGRLVYRPPFLKGLQVGGSGAWGSGERADQPRRDRLGGEVLFQRGPVTLKGEVMTAKDQDFRRLGYYGHFGYRFTPDIEGIVRVDTFDPDRRFEANAGNVTERDYIAGVNYFVLENHVKLQLNYLRKTFDEDIVRSRSLLLLNLQTSW